MNLQQIIVCLQSIYTQPTNGATIGASDFESSGLTSALAPSLPLLDALWLDFLTAQIDGNANFLPALAVAPAALCATAIHAIIVEGTMFALLTVCGNLVIALGTFLNASHVVSVVNSAMGYNPT